MMDAVLAGARVLDGGMASELEFLGEDISGPLWSAHVLEQRPEQVLAVHRAYLKAGADMLLTASYQVSRMGYVEVGLQPHQADAALLRAVELARAAQAEFATQSLRRVIIAASLGPYGAALHDGSEYHGNYDVGYAELVPFHAERIAVLSAGPADVLAFETLPSFDEARAVVEALQGFPDVRAWVSFTCCDERHVAHGEMLRECAAMLDAVPQVVAVGVNCTRPEPITALIGEIRAGTGKPVIVYPNSGEGWDARNRRWTGASDAVRFAELAAEWFDAGAQIVGGCCRTRPEHIREVAEKIRERECE